MVISASTEREASTSLLTSFVIFSDNNLSSSDTSMSKYSAHLITSLTEVVGALHALFLAFQVIDGIFLTLLMITFSYGKVIKIQPSSMIIELLAFRTGGVISKSSVSIENSCFIAKALASVTDDTGIRQTLDTLSHLEPAILLTSSTCSLS